MTRLPVAGKFAITCEFDKKGDTWKAGRHTGIDIVSDNRIVYGTGKGVVTKVGYDKSYGNFVVVKINDYFHWFCHLSKINVTVGEMINEVSRIGIMGRTGNASGVHLHWEIRKSCNCYNQVVNPCEYAGIVNKVGNYDSSDFFVLINNEKNMTTFNVGNQVLVQALDCGARRGNDNNQMLVEIPYLQVQIWIMTKDFYNNNIICTIFAIEGHNLCVDVGTYYQFSINSKEVIKYGGSNN